MNGEKVQGQAGVKFVAIEQFGFHSFEAYCRYAIFSFIQTSEPLFPKNPCVTILLHRTALYPKSMFPSFPSVRSCLDNNPRLDQHQATPKQDPHHNNPRRQNRSHLHRRSAEISIRSA